MTVIMIGVQEPLLRLINTPEESFLEAKNYFFVTMLGTLFIFAYNAQIIGTQNISVFIGNKEFQILNTSHWYNL